MKFSINENDKAPALSYELLLPKRDFKTNQNSVLYQGEILIIQSP